MVTYTFTLLKKIMIRLLPNMGSIIHRYMQLLNLDPALKKLVRLESVFVSHRKNRTIGDILIHNRYRPSGSQSLDEERNLCIPEPRSRAITYDGCSGYWGCNICRVSDLGDFENELYEFQKKSLNLRKTMHISVQARFHILLEVAGPRTSISKARRASARRSPEAEDLAGGTPATDFGKKVF